MEIKFEFSDTELNAIQGLLKSNLNIEDNDLNARLNNIAKTAFYEYVLMISKSGIPSKVNDIIQNRIMYLIEHYFKRFPNENGLARIFNIPLTKSRSLLNTLKSTHRNQLRSIFKSSIITFLEQGDDIGDEMWEFQIQSKPILNELNEIIELKSPGKSKFKTKVNSAGKVLLHVDSYNFLKTEFGL